MVPLRSSKRKVTTMSVQRNRFSVSVFHKKGFCIPGFIDNLSHLQFINLSCDGVQQSLAWNYVLLSAAL